MDLLIAKTAITFRCGGAPRRPDKAGRANAREAPADEQTRMMDRVG
jgi:hypothetical protein